MRADVAHDLSASAHEFQRAVWPRISVYLGGGELHPVEAVTHQGFDKHLDALAGIDAWQIKRGHGIRGIASRVQWIDTDNPRHRRFDTFSIRMKRPSGAETEFEKRMRIIRDPDGGFILPEFTVQAYMSEPKRQGDLLSVAVVRTRALFLLADALREGGGCGARRGRDFGTNVAGNGGQEFMWISWDYIHRNPETQPAIRISRRIEPQPDPEPEWAPEYESAAH